MAHLNVEECAPEHIHDDWQEQREQQGHVDGHGHKHLRSAQKTLQEAANGPQQLPILKYYRQLAHFLTIASIMMAYDGINVLRESVRYAAHGCCVEPRAGRVQNGVHKSVMKHLDNHIIDKNFK